MAIFHFKSTAVQRSKAHSSVAKAAYISGSKLTDRCTGVVNDHSRRDDVHFRKIVLPPGAGAWASCRDTLWNTAESEKRKNLIPAREYEVAIPMELCTGQQEALALRFAKELARDDGCAVDLCIHRPHSSGHGDPRNIHAHLLRSTREPGAHGFGQKLACEKAQPKGARRDHLVRWRARWAELANQALAAAGYSARIDHRSYRKLKIKLSPTVHIGPADLAIAESGGDSFRQDLHDLQRIKQQAEIAARPELVLEKLAAIQHVFTRSDVVHELNRYVTDPDLFQRLAKELACSPELVEVQYQTASGTSFFTTRAVLDSGEEITAASVDCTARSDSKPHDTGQLVNPHPARNDNFADQNASSVFEARGRKKESTNARRLEPSSWGRSLPSDDFLAAADRYSGISERALSEPAFSASSRDAAEVAQPQVPARRAEAASQLSLFAADLKPAASISNVDGRANSTKAATLMLPEPPETSFPANDLPDNSDDRVLRNEPADLSIHQPQHPHRPKLSQTFPEVGVSALGYPISADTPENRDRDESFTIQSGTVDVHKEFFGQPTAEKAGRDSSTINKEFLRKLKIWQPAMFSRRDLPRAAGPASSSAVRDSQSTAAPAQHIPSPSSDDAQGQQEPVRDLAGDRSGSETTTEVITGVLRGSGSMSDGYQFVHLELEDGSFTSIVGGDIADTVLAFELEVGDEVTLSRTNWQGVGDWSLAPAEISSSARPSYSPRFG